MMQNDTPQRKIDVIAGRYELVQMLGSGGAAIVYKAFDRATRRNVTCKILHGKYVTDPTYVEMFRMEAEIGKRLTRQKRHPHIATYLDSGNSMLDGREVYYNVSEYVDGCSLKEYIYQNGRLSQREAINIAMAILDALSYMHGKGIIHGDIKPQNVLINPQTAEIKLIDLGSAHDRSHGHTIDLTKRMATVEYISPEQVRGLAPDMRSEMYSVAVILYEMLTGQLPFVSDSFTVTMNMHVNAQPVPPKELRHDITNAMQEIILKGMRKSSDTRYQTAQEFRRDLMLARKRPAGGFVDSGASTEETDTRRDARKGGKNRPSGIKVASIVAITSVLVAMVTLVTVMAVSRYTRATTAPNTVNMELTAAADELAENGLTYSVIEAYSDETPQGLVISQSPEKGTPLEKGDCVILTVSKGMDRVMVPLVTGSTRSEASAALDAISLMIGEETLVVSDREAGIVISQSPEAGQWLEPGSRVALTISGESVPVPATEGMTEADAVALLEDAGLHIAAKVWYPSSDGETGTVHSTYPAPETRVLRGSDVTLTLYSAAERTYSCVVELTFPVETDEDSALVRVLVSEPDDTVIEEHSSYSPAVSSMHLTLSMERTTPGSRELTVYVNDQPVETETVMFD